MQALVETALQRTGDVKSLAVAPNAAAVARPKRV